MKNLAYLFVIRMIFQIKHYMNKETNQMSEIKILDFI